MANEAVLIVETELPVNYTVANGTGIEKGAILKLSDPMTVALADGTANLTGGIAAEEKIASDGKTKLAVYRGGIFRVKASGAVTVGDPLVTSANSLNEVRRADGAASGASGAKILGFALETAATTETFLMELRPSIVGVINASQ